MSLHKQWSACIKLIIDFDVNWMNVTDDESSKSSSLSVCIWVQPSPLQEMVPHLSGDRRLQLHRGTYWKDFSKCCNYLEPLAWWAEPTRPNQVLSKYWIIWCTLCMTVEFLHCTLDILLFRKVQKTSCYENFDMHTTAFYMFRSVMYHKL